MHNSTAKKDDYKENKTRYIYINIGSFKKNELKIFFSKKLINFWKIFENTKNNLKII